MKILVDEMWPEEVAEQLRRRGHDVSSVVVRPELLGHPDSVVFLVAQREQRAILTENVDDYRVIAAQVIVSGGFHYGLILTSNRRFPRNRSGTLGRLIIALHGLLLQDPDLRNVEHWLK